MARNSHRMIIAAFVAMGIALTSGTASAADETYRPRQTGDWGDYSGGASQVTWEVFRNNQWVAVTTAADIPNTGDTVRICTYTVSVTDSQNVSTIVINASGGECIGGGGQLIIQGNGVLTIGGASPIVVVNPLPFSSIRVLDGGRLVASATMMFTTAGTGRVDIEAGGVLELDTADTTVTFSLLVVFSGGALRVSADDANTIFNIDAIYDDSTIEIGPNSGSGSVTFTGGTIEGSATIKRNPVNASGVAIFANQGQVVAEGGTILLDSSLYQVSGVGLWETSSGGTLQFNKSATGLTGNIRVFGTLVINASVATSGLFGFYAGAVVDIVDLSSHSLNVTGTGGVGSGNHYLSGSDCTSVPFPFTEDQGCDG